MSTPHVSGVAALLWSRHQSATAIQIRDAMYTTALSLGSGIFYGNGLVQAQAAMASLDGPGGPVPGPQTPAPTPSPTPSPPGTGSALSYVRECTPFAPCGLCEGDCDNDSGCALGLKCFFRNDFTPVPGCRGSGTNALDYCHVPELTFTGQCSPSRPCGLCEGDCNSDNDCEAGLRCGFRSGTQSILGCQGTGISGYDYCYWPSTPFTTVSAAGEDEGDGCADGVGSFHVNNRLGERDCAWLAGQSTRVSSFCTEGHPAYQECKATCGSCTSE
mmetsp:Transcript_22742/g.52610  ORF Transcript_22742/g.52610 Transcript_22742/m.52610 type:complete len:273 (-) Transcript_22742:147-965(-)